jgi:hypothetical protein
MPKPAANRVVEVDALRGVTTIRSSAPAKSSENNALPAF